MTGHDAKPCKHGHARGRNRFGHCLECGRLAQARRRLALPIEEQRASGRAYYHANKESRAASAAAWHQAHKDLVRERKAKWWAAHPDEMRLYARNRRARKAASGESHTPSDIAEITEMQGHKCAYCRVSFKESAPQVDHINPLKRGGSNGRRNLQIVCRPCNSSKRAKDPVDFAQSRGMLL